MKNIKYSTSYQITTKIILTFLYCCCIACNSSKNVGGHQIEIIKEDNLSSSSILVDKINRLLSHNYFKKSEENPKYSYGFLDRNNNIIILPKYDYASFFFGNYANVMKDHIHGYIDKEGNEYWFPEYESVFWYYQPIGFAFKDEMYALIDRSGNLKTEFIYDQVSLTNSNFYKVRLNGNWIVVNEEGKKVLDESYHLTNKTLFDGRVTFSNSIEKKKIGLLNINKDTLIPPKYDKISLCCGDNVYKVTKGEEITYFDKKGFKINKKTEKQIFSKKNLYNLRPDRKKGKYGYVDLSNNIIIDYQYENAKPFSEGLALVKKDNKILYIDKNNDPKIILDNTYKKNGDFSNGLAFFQNDKGKFGYIDILGNELIPAIYDSALSFENELAYVSINKSKGFIDTKGKIIIPINYNEIWGEKNGLFKFRIVD